MVAKRWTSHLTPSILAKKPFLVGGLGLTIGMSLWNLVMPDPSTLLGTATWGAIALGAGAWWLSRRDTALDLTLPSMPAIINRDSVEAALGDAKQAIEQFSAEAERIPQGRDYQNAIALLQHHHQELTEALDRSWLHGVVMGTKGVGKTALVDHLAVHPWTTSSSNETVPILSFKDTGALLAPTTAPSFSVVADAVPELQQADLVLFVTEGDITASELQVIRTLLAQRFEVVVVFNKSDRHLPDTRQTIGQRLQERLSPSLAPAAIVATAAIATDLKVRQHQPDGTVRESMSQNPAQLNELMERVQHILDQGSARLILPTTLRQTHQLQQEVQRQWNHLRRDRARPILEKYQWIAAATAFANPLPTFDLVATGAINAQLLADLGHLYGQPFTLDQAKIATGTLAELMVKLGLVELTTQAIAPLLKTHTLTFAAGGAVQGISAAYLTQVAGLSVIQYLEELCIAQATQGQIQTQSSLGSNWNLDRLGQIMQQVFQTYQRGEFLQGLVDQGMKRFGDRLRSASQSTTAAVAR